jgi:hypothetical protein
VRTGLVRSRTGLISLPQTPDHSPPADELGPTGRAAAVVGIVGFTWLVPWGFKQLINVF